MSPSDDLSGALEGVMTRFGRMLRAVGRRRGLGDADLDELEQDVRIRLWRALAGGETIRAVHTSYVYQAAVSAALDLIRRRRARPEEPLDPAAGRGPAHHAPGGEAPDALLERRELGARIDRAVTALAEPRDIVVRLHLSGYDRWEIARLLGWTEPKVRNLLYRGLADLRATLRERGIGPQRVA
jgi:RNA polymerase sigma-70 factor (ECF subfamily)